MKYFLLITLLCSSCSYYKVYRKEYRYRGNMLDSLFNTIWVAKKPIEIQNKRVNKFFVFNTHAATEEGRDLFRPYIYSWSCNYELCLTMMRDFSILEFTADPRQGGEGYFYLPEKKLTVHYTLIRTKDEHLLVDSIGIDRLPYDPAHWGLRMIAGDTTEMQCGMSYLTTTVHKNNAWDWTVGVKLYQPLCKNTQ